jgi:hypothetical protein
MLLPGRSADELQQHRWDTGLHIQMVPDFSEYIEEIHLDNYFTAYSYFNLNICDEFALEKLVSTRTGDEITALEIRQRIQEVWKESKPGKPRMIEADELDDILGAQHRRLFPLINANPVLNVHFMPEEILYQLFSFKYHEVPPERAQFIINTREQTEWSKDDLQAVIGENYLKTFLHHYIGVITWFWELNIQSFENDQDQASLRWVIARVPEEGESHDTIQLRLIEEDIIFE